MKNYQLNAKLKILIIVFYTLLLFGIILLIFGNTKYKRFEGYSSKPYDENIALSIRAIENRRSKYYTGDKKELGEHEKATFDLQVSLVKLQSKAIIDDIRIYVSAQTVDGGYRYKEYSSSSKLMSEYTYTSTTSFSSFSTKEVVEKTENEKTKEFLFDEEPTKFFVKVTYTEGKNDRLHTLTYQTSVLDLKNKKFDSAEIREIMENNGTNPEYVDPKTDPVRIKLTKEETTELSKPGTAKNDKIKVQFNVLKTNLNKFKLSDEYLKEKNLKMIELPNKTDSNDVWDVAPEISEIKLEVYVKIKSTDEQFSELVKIYSLYGFMSKHRDPSIANISIDESFDVEEIYVIAEGKLYNANQESFSIFFNCKFSELPTFVTTD